MLGAGIFLIHISFHSQISKNQKDWKCYSLIRQKLTGLNKKGTHHGNVLPWMYILTKLLILSFLLMNMISIQLSISTQALWLPAEIRFTVSLKSLLMQHDENSCIIGSHWSNRVYQGNVKLLRGILWGRMDKDLIRLSLIYDS